MTKLERQLCEHLILREGLVEQRSVYRAYREAVGCRHESESAFGQEVRRWYSELKKLELRAKIERTKCPDWNFHLSLLKSSESGWPEQLPFKESADWPELQQRLKNVALIARNLRFGKLT